MSSSVPRREFLKTLTAGVALPGTAAAALTPIPDQVFQLRQQWATLKRGYLDTLFYERTNVADFAEDAERLGDGLGAMKVFKDIEPLDVEVQAHPAMQVLIRDIAEAVGRAIQTSRSLLEDYVSGPGESDEGEANLRSAIQATRYTTLDWRCDPVQKQLMASALLDLERNSTPGALRREARRLLRRVKRMERLAAGLAERNLDTGLLTSTDPVAVRRVNIARKRWGAPPAVDPQSPAFVLGILALGLLFIVGAYVAVAGLCVLACEGSIGLLLLGMAVMGLSVWAGVSLLRSAREQTRPTDNPWVRHVTSEPGALPDAAAPQAAPPVDAATATLQAAQVSGEVTVTAAHGWVPTSLQLQAGQTVHLTATGQIGSSAGWIAPPDGNGVAAGSTARLPGAPQSALICRIGGHAFFVGSEARIVAPIAGRLWLSTNQSEQTAGAEGQLTVRFNLEG